MFSRGAQSQTFPPQSVNARLPAEGQSPSCGSRSDLPASGVCPPPVVCALQSGRPDFLSERGAEGSRCQSRPPPPPPPPLLLLPPPPLLPLGGGVSRPRGGRRGGLGFLSEDAQGSGRPSVCECVSVSVGARRVSPAAVPPPPRRRCSRWKSM
ncbi:neural Wiskott-Aldrich syndrome protein-like [Elephas maximus indicus]|uniref:neural Wiskott-Aldrich syndrome protein-like n=1 Tax=Elephas maximus indicus TaxID=99487 RepID=UPI002117138B|nr:neural Wiskott-Aldrich syndrome protein-like [Elephas maximus indicus]